VTRSRTSELAIAAWGGLTFAALLASFTAFRPVRDALVLDGNPDDIPWLFSATFIAALIASRCGAASCRSARKRRVVPVTFHVFAVCLGMFAGVWSRPGSSR